jgi:hypothetical protein
MGRQQPRKWLSRHLNERRPLYTPTDQAVSKQRPEEHKPPAVPAEGSAPHFAELFKSSKSSDEHPSKRLIRLSQQVIPTPSQVDSNYISTISGSASQTALLLLLPSTTKMKFTATFAVLAVLASKAVVHAAPTTIQDSLLDARSEFIVSDSFNLLPTRRKPSLTLLTGERSRRGLGSLLR